VCRHSLKSLRVEKNCSCLSTTRSPAVSPQATTICLHLDGLLLKSQPSKRVIGGIQRLTSPSCVNFFAESVLKTRAAILGL
jgi:hypothetical protein